MIVLFNNINTDNLLVFDAEYNQGSLIQFAGILFRRVEKDLFQISRSLNIYVKPPCGEKINEFITRFTGITDEFLEENGVFLDEAVEVINQLTDIEDLTIVSHGISNDYDILFDNGIDLLYNQTDKTKKICTYRLARRVLKREKKLKLSNIAAEAGMLLHNNHDAFQDTWATVAILSFLKKIEGEE